MRLGWRVPQWKMVREFLMEDDSEREDKDESDDDSGE